MFLLLNPSQILRSMQRSLFYGVATSNKQLADIPKSRINNSDKKNFGDI